MKIVFTPDWFLNNDILIDVISFFILFVFFLFAVKGFKMTNKKSILYLGFGFLLIAVGELSTILTKLVLYYDTSITREIGRAVINSNLVPTVDIFYYAGFFFTKFLTLLGMYVIFKIPHIKKLSSEFLLIIYLLFMVALFSQGIPFIYDLTALTLLTLIVRNYSIIYRENESRNTLILISVFSLLWISHLIFIFSNIGSLYIIAQSLQLVSYITMLFLIIRILKNGKEEKPNRHSK
ncbi:MAG: hypothetical protein WDZ77_00205 [Candidatus Pacearchaeota archaeon]